MSADRRLILWLLLLAVGVGLLFLMRSVLMPFLLGMAIAYLLDPVADRLETIGCPRGLAAAGIIVGFFAVAGGALVVLVPALQAQVLELVSALPDYVAGLVDSVRPLVAKLRAQLSPDQQLKVREVLADRAGDIASLLSGLVGGLISGGIAILSAISLLLVTPVVAFYLLRDWDYIVATIDQLLPLDGADVIREAAREIDARLSGFVRGQAMVCLSLGMFYAAGLTLVGLKYGLLIGFGAGLISFIPYFGTIVGFAVSMGVAISQFTDWTWIAVVAAIFIAGQVIEGNVLTPVLVGDRIGLHPVWIMFALFAGGALLGFTGMLIAVPLAAVIGVIVRFLILRYRGSSLYSGGTAPASGPPPR